jgi:hypothetical protein
MLQERNGGLLDVIPSSAVYGQKNSIERLYWRGRGGAFLTKTKGTNHIDRLEDGGNCEE